MWQLNARAVAHFMMKCEIFIRECMDAHGEPGPQSEASDEPVVGCILYSIMALPEIAKHIHAFKHDSPFQSALQRRIA